MLEAQPQTRWSRFRKSAGKFRRYLSRRHLFRLYLKVVGHGLTEEQALSRICMVFMIEFVGVVLTIILICCGPGKFTEGDKVYWKLDCGYIAAGLFLFAVFLGLTFAVSWLRRWRPSIPEGIILLTFIVNIIAFSMAMARTGGTHSFFGQLIPMQLSGILILEQQKTMFKTSSQRYRAWFYATFTVIVWVIAVWCPMKFAALFGWGATSIETINKFYENLVATILFILGMGVTAGAYWFTPRLAASFRRPERRPKVQV